MKESNDITNHQVKAQEVLHLLSDRNAVTILKRILLANTCICGDFIGVLDMSNHELTDQLKKMLSSGIIKGNIEGTKICYCISPDMTLLLQNILDSTQTAYTANQYCNEC
ncbi:helix-turn-helix transcriptional regulator [Pedobacter sp. ISL-68]|uniref:ArsR/SmtB family transcription factor n=1 Tax=unclassified Pedobacter TaxID=2628915 RepID=UPI001BEA7A46|nr:MULTISPECIES: hypothetical protein [unclassified Pedobacter]MBT2560809.1 helix-turn-helix transcriptional regulator [Pedobacter sp. ISL-64]MBT2590188.1 helix-turn-helix transcriptional regulator [Pedobacter sp. ISL-68]